MNANLYSFQKAVLLVSYRSDLAEKYFPLAKIEAGAAQTTPLGGCAAAGCRQHGV